MSEVVLNITGMTCQHCVARAKKAIEATDGVENVAVTLEPGQASVVGSATTESLIVAIADAGYTAEVAS